jgi:ribosomal protein S27AE
MRQFKTREQYLVAMAKEINDVFFIPAGYPVDLSKVKVSCGFTSQGGKRNAAIGQCFNDKANGFNEIFIHPVLADESRVGDVLAHEMIHAYDNCKHGHRGPFRRIAKAIGLTGKMTATVASDEMNIKLAKIQKKLGKYPHEALDYEPKKKQGTRMLKVECPDCGSGHNEFEEKYFVRLSRTMLAKGHPICGQCGDSYMWEV